MGERSSASSRRSRSRDRTTTPAERVGPPPRPGPGADRFCAVGILVLVLAAYAPAFRAGWVWDDDSYVTANPALRSLDGLRRIWTEPGAVAQYYPLTFTTLWAEYQIHGLRPAGYHATNVGLHAANAVLVGAVLARLAVPGAWLAAALFAVHPLHVESVAWVTERKNVLSGAFYLLALLALLRWRDSAPGTGRGWYLAGAGAFLAALLSKTVTATLPVAYLVACWWRWGRVRRADLAAMLPFLAAGALSGAVTATLERTHVGAVGAYWDETLAERVLIAGRALWFYVGKLLVPAPLVFVYPRWTLDVAAASQWLWPAAALVAGAALAAATPRLGRGPLAAALAYAVTLGPALGFAAVYPMRYSYVADHFAYLASVPLLALAAAGATRWARGTTASLRRGASVACLALLAALTWARAEAFRDADTLWRDTIAKNPRATIAYLNLGHATYEAGRYAEAVALFDRGLEVEPDAADLLSNRGLALGALGRTSEALASFARAVAADPSHAEARSNLGNALAAGGRYAEAEAAYREVLRLRPAHPEAHNNLGNVLALRGAVGEALAHYDAAIAADPAYVDAHRNRAEVLLGAGRAAAACEGFEAALRLEPRLVEAVVGRMRCLAALGRPDDAVAAGRAALAWAGGAEALQAELARALEAAKR